MLSTLVLTVCLATNPDICRSVPISTEPPLALPYVCARVGQEEAAKYIEEHPGWVVKKWRCGPPRNET